MHCRKGSNLSHPQQPSRPPRAAAEPLGLPGRQRPVRSRRNPRTTAALAGGTVLAVMLGVVTVVNVVSGPANQARGLADGFTRLVLAGDSARAYDDYFDPALQERLSKEEFIAGVKTLEMDGTCRPAYDDVTAGTENGSKAADIAGLVTCDGDKKIDLVYRFEGADELKMVTVRLKPRV